VRDPYWYTLFSENVGDPVVETFGDIWDLQVRQFGVERSRVFLMVLGVLSFVYSAFRIPVKVEDVVKHVLMLCGCRFCRALIVDTFLLITNEVDVRHSGHPTIALSSHLSISPYRRYVDDIYLQTTGEEMADQFHYTMNSLHPKLKFEIEKPEITPNGLSLPLLDFNVTISKDGK